MVKIWLAPDHAIRMSELAEQVLLSRSWLTRRIIQLEAAGLIVRRSDDTDGRGVLAVMTEHGHDVFRAMEASHTRSIAKHFSAHLTADEATVVATALGRIAAAGRVSLAERSHS
jgi:DNA-binding MarR family transcriptional regulator